MGSRRSPLSFAARLLLISFPSKPHELLFLAALLNFFPADSIPSSTPFLTDHLSQSAKKYAFETVLLTEILFQAERKHTFSPLTPPSAAFLEKKHTSDPFLGEKVCFYFLLLVWHFIQLKLKAYQFRPNSPICGFFLENAYLWPRFRRKGMLLFFLPFGTPSWACALTKISL